MRRIVQITVNFTISAQVPPCDTFGKSQSATSNNRNLKVKRMLEKKVINDVLSLETALGDDAP